MKMRSFFRMGVLLTAICLTAAGCGKDDKTPEQLPDPLDTTTEYYLVGVVSSAEGVVKGAEVKITDDIKATTDAQGKYNLTLSKTGDYTNRKGKQAGGLQHKGEHRIIRQKPQHFDAQRQNEQGRRIYCP